jgi:predicted MFS family arabinose efflux permease
MWLTAENFQAVFWFAVVPAVACVLVLILFVKEPERPEGLRKVRAPLSLSEMRRLGAPYWWVTALATVFTLARFSEAFLLLRAQSAGLAVALVPLVLVVMNVAYAFSAYPAGALADRVNKVSVLALGLLLLIAADVLLAFDLGLAGVTAGVVLWGLHMGLTQGLLASLVADTSPPELRGTAFGVFNMLGGVALLLASIVAGLLWDMAGAGMTFAVGAVITGLALVGLLVLRWRLPALGAVHDAPAAEPPAA